MIVGTNAVWLLALTPNPEANILVALPAAAIASLVPDLDATGRGAKIHYLGGGFLKVFIGAFHHRGILHSLFAVGVLFIFLFLVNLLALENEHPFFPFVISLSYLSHSVIDGLNRGVGFFFPFNKKMYSLLPKSMWSPVDGFTDNLLFVIGCFGLLLFFVLLYLPSKNSLI